MYIPIKLDKTRNLLLGFEAMQLFKKMTGKSLARLDFENEDFEDYVPTMLYCGLVHEDREITLEKTVELLDEHLGLKGTMDLLPMIMEEVFGKQDLTKNAPRAAKK